MTKDESSGKIDGFAAQWMPMMALAASMNQDWLKMASLGGFPGSAADGGADAANPWQSMIEAQAGAIASSWQQLGDAMTDSAGKMRAGQDGMAEAVADQMNTLLRSFIGMDPQEMMAATSGGEWTPKSVAFQSFGPVDGDMATLGTEMAQLSMASGEASRTMFDLYRVVSDAWMNAARVFATKNAGNDIKTVNIVEQQRQWVATAEPILQKALASESFVKANADFIRASSRLAKARSAFARRFTDLIEVPSRQEMDETYEAIQELRREVRALRRNQKRLEQALNETAADARAEHE